MLQSFVNHCKYNIDSIDAQMLKIAVLVSGGVDSAVALKLLQDQGHTVTAFYLKIWLADELSFLGECPWEEDLSYVRQVCAQLQVPLEIAPFQQAYQDRVVQYTMAEIKAGRTPNPDIMCNRQVKFGAFLDYLLAEKTGQFDYVASGHYAQVTRQAGQSFLMIAPDPVKDQTYFLAYLTQAQLAKIIFPIGHLAKSQVRALAQQFNLPNKDRKDSQGICFLGKLKFPEFVKFHLGEKTGDLIEFETGQKLGAHRGVWFYTIGQRQGLGLSGGPWYVVAKDLVRNLVYISRTYYAVDKERRHLTVGQLNWIAGQPPTKTQLRVKLRHGVPYHDCEITGSADQQLLQVTLAVSDQGIAPGQFAVFYDGEICLGGGVIV